MAETIDQQREVETEGGEEVYSKAVRAGRRTYFFDVKATRGNDYFLTITESRKRQGKDGNFFFDKHKIYLYKEDFLKFSDGLEEVIAYIRKHKPEFFDRLVAERTALYSPDEEFDRL